MRQWRCSPPSWTDESNSRDQASAFQSIVESKDIPSNDVCRVQFAGKIKLGFAVPERDLKGTLNGWGDTHLRELTERDCIRRCSWCASAFRVKENEEENLKKLGERRLKTGPKKTISFRSSFFFGSFFGRGFFHWWLSLWFPVHKTPDYTITG